MKPYRSALLALGPLSLLFTPVTWSATAIVLPGLHEQGIDLRDAPVSAAAALEWELVNADVVFGAYENKSDNERVNAIGYMYNQKLELNSGWLENDIRNQAEINNIDYEDFFLHFSEDTIIAEIDSSHGENTLLNRKPMIVGYTASADHAGFWLYQQPPWDADVFGQTNNGGALYVYHSEKFDRLAFTFSQFAQGGRFTIEYPSAIDSFGQVSQWKPFDINKDKTLNMTKNQTVNWSVPSDWVRATTHYGSGKTYGGGQYFGSTFLRDGGRLYVAKITWHDENIENRPRLKEVKLKNGFQTVKLTDAPKATPEGQTIQRWRKIRGFDKSADLNQDNYLSWNEYTNRSNKNATARFRWESRVIPFGRMWNQTSSWALTNLGNPEFANAMHHYYQAEWAKQGLNGAYNDDTNKLLGANQFYVYSGGTVDELGLVAGSQAADDAYKAQFSAFLNKLATLDADALIGLNIDTANLFGRNGQNHLVEAGSLYLREHYLFPSTGFSGYAGLAKFWDNSALAKAGQKVIYQATTRYGRVQYFGNTEDNWKQDQYSTLAAFYLNHHPERSFFNQWNSSYLYGSNNTTAENFWKAGVPKNIAYQPSALLAVDLGEPANLVPEGAAAMPLMLSTSTPPKSDYTIIGDSTMNKVEHVGLPGDITYLYPTYIYFAYRSSTDIVAQGPSEMVLAREFTNGRVLYRTDFFGKNANYFSAPKITITLDKPMRPVDKDGNIGGYVSHIEIGGYEGVFLLY
ncbi:hypothetical protein [Vibrio campbellii]|uniref:Uncharacterized protein n=1 Tax=Vibrio campbellii (strain ATCC BAA-1116) TaxID=2902295 RepID=A7N4B9_VIBC1|nr:hypothetical protein [Vibrio campbellii]ABU73422.1 hypothetical protein VIBHAR_05518 [Vibrio campbellii ATCC BAA-1116]MBT0124026.1 hypothetical protein [Vibrio campbellii]MBT0138931.1 hypothetical protein [Vibrio campbellii]MBT0143634.1 hypothetical protein [Vibrio campbellii]MBT0148300.1 hypothetical protein [Vibrio campbellii]